MFVDLIYFLKRVVKIYMVVEVLHFKSPPSDLQYIEESGNYEMFKLVG